MLTESQVGLYSLLNQEVRATLRGLDLCVL